MTPRQTLTAHADAIDAAIAALKRDAAEISRALSKPEVDWHDVVACNHMRSAADVYLERRG